MLLCQRILHLSDITYGITKWFRDSTAQIVSCSNNKSANENYVLYIFSDDDDGDDGRVTEMDGYTVAQVSQASIV